MFFLKETVDKAVAGGVNTDFTKPTGDKIRIRFVSVKTQQALEFGVHTGWLENLSEPIITMGLYRKWIPDTLGYPVCLFNGQMDWPEDWKLRLRTVTQVASDTIRLVVGYETGLPKVEVAGAKKPWPGWNP